MECTTVKYIKTVAPTFLYSCVLQINAGDLKGVKRHLGYKTLITDKFSNDWKNSDRELTVVWVNKEYLNYSLVDFAESAHKTIKDKKTNPPIISKPYDEFVEDSLAVLEYLRGLDNKCKQP